MRGSLGEKIGQGAMADIHAWASGQVVKLYKPGRERRLGRHEAQMTRAVFGNLLPKHLARGVLALLESLPPGGRAVPWRRSPRQRDHDGRGSETHRLDLDEAGGPRPRPGALPRRPLRAHPGKPRRSGAAARARWATSRPPATHAPSTYKIPVPSECRRSSTCSWWMPDRDA